MISPSNILVKSSLQLSDFSMEQMNVPWVESPFFEQLLEQANFDEKTQKIVKDFAENGYVVIDPEIEDFEELATDISTNFHYEHKGKVGDAWFFKDRIQDAWTFNDSVKKIAIAPRILELLKVLYRREPIPFQTLNFRVGTQQTTHSDAIHFHSVPSRFMCGVWIALEDIDLNNGPVHYYPGSHKLPIVDLNDLGLIATTQKKSYQYYPVYEKFLQDLIKTQGLQKVDLQIRKGQALVWAANLLHGGSPILDSMRTRFSQVTHFYFADCMYYIPMLSDPFIKKMHLKRVKNVINGELVPQFYNGQLIPNYYFDDLEEGRRGYQVDILQKELEKANDRIYCQEEELQKLHSLQQDLQTGSQQVEHDRLELKMLKSQVTLLEAELERVRAQLYQSQSALNLVEPQLTMVQEELNRIRPQMFAAQAKLLVNS